MARVVLQVPAKRTSKLSAPMRLRARPDEARLAQLETKAIGYNRTNNLQVVHDETGRGATFSVDIDDAGVRTQKKRPKGRFFAGC